MTQESEGPTKLQDFIKDYGAPDRILRDNSKIQNSERWLEIERKYGILQATSEHQPIPEPSRAPNPNCKEWS